MELTNTPAPNATLQARLDVREHLKAIIKEATAQLEAENDAITDELVAAGLDDIVVGDQRVVLSVRSGRASLDKARLVELGVSTTIIEQATKRGPDYMQLDVRAAK